MFLTVMQLGDQANQVIKLHMFGSLKHARLPCKRWSGHDLSNTLHGIVPVGNIARLVFKESVL